MSTPRSLDLHTSVQRVRVQGSGIDLAALLVEPDATTTPGNPPDTVLLVHGFTGSKEDFGTVLPLLAAGGHRAIAVDLRGQHESDEHDEVFDIERFADDLVAVIRGQQGPVHLVGHSFGGLVGREAVLQDPAAVTTFTLMCSGPGAVPQSLTDTLGAFDTAMEAGAVDLVWDYMRHERMTTDPDVDEAVLQFLERRLRSGHPDAHRAIARGLLEIPDRTDELAATGVPVLVLWGEDDDVWPIAEQRRTAERLGAAEVELGGAGHSPAVDDPESTAAALLAWIDGAGRRA